MKHKWDLTKYLSGVGAGLLAAVLLTGFAAVILAYLISNEKTDFSAISYAAIIIYILCAMIGAILAFVKVGENRMIVCLATGLSYYLVLLCCNMLLFSQGFHGSITGLLCILVGSLGATLLGLKKGGLNRKKYKY